MQPTVGRMVYYKSFGSPGGEHASIQRAAVITAVISLTLVSLCVINPTGLYFNENVTQGDGPGQWDWMPYQKERAAQETTIGFISAAQQSKPPDRSNDVVIGADAKFEFGMALDFLQAGKRVARSGWNGRGMWIQMQRPDTGSKMTAPYLYIEYPSGHPVYPDGCRVPWSPSQTDLLADDWIIVTD